MKINGRYVEGENVFEILNGTPPAIIDGLQIRDEALYYVKGWFTESHLFATENKEENK